MLRSKSSGRRSRQDRKQQKEASANKKSAKVSLTIDRSPEKMESSKENKISDFSFQDRKQIEEKIDETI